MKNLLICKDCGDQFKSSDVNNELFEIYKNNQNRNVFLTKCMGKCPINKISVIEIFSSKVNDMDINFLELDEIKSLIYEEL